MDFKKYVSTLFYLHEAHGYASPAIQTQLENLIIQTNAEAFEDTGYFCFQLYNDLKVVFPDLGWKWNNPKDSFKKTSASLSIRRVLSDEESTRIGAIDQYRQRDVRQENVSVIGGDCAVHSVAYATPHYYEGKPMLLVTFELVKGRSYEDPQELAPLVECLRNMLTQI